MSSSAPLLRKLILLLTLAAYPAHPLAQDSASVLRPATPVRQADAICAKCHQDIFRKYLDTPMANASGLASDRIFTGGFHHAPSGIDYRISNKDGSLWLNYSRPGDAGLQGSQKLDYFLGSGHLGITYLYSVNGYFLESPVAYYADSKAYDMKPGLGALPTMPPALPMTRGCMRCHMSDVQREDPGTRNHFKGLPFLHGGVTCESCHGDTTLHLSSSGKAPVINPIKLDAERRDSVCISCHLEGDTRIEHAGRNVDDYKPGERIADYLSYFVYADDSMMSRGVSEVEEFGLSKCKRVSGDRMSCMNCHDPHYSPPPAEQAAFYRQKCLACHTAPKYTTTHFNMNPDCTNCHMPKGKVEKVPHIAWTDHRIRQNPDQFGASDSPAARELVPLFRETASPRDLALAYYDLVLGGNASEKDRAWTLLSSSRNSSPNDLPVLNALGYLAQLRGNSTQAMDLYREVLKLDPIDLTATNNLAILLAKSGQLKEAETLWKKTFDLNEDVDEPGINLALVECMLGEKDDAQQVLQRVLLYSPDHPIARRKLQAIQSGKETCTAP
jgi:predicted CXXCH cytochrome family protein